MESPFQDDFLKAILENNIGEVEELLKIGCDPDIKINEFPLIHICAARNYTEMTKLLLKWDCNINQAGPSGVTALHAATQKGNLEMISLLIENHADVNAVTEWWGTPLHFTSLQRHIPSEVIKMLVSAGGNLDKIDIHLNTPLNLACQFRCWRVVREMIDCGASVNNENARGDTALLLVLQFPDLQCTTSMVEIVDFLIKRGADINHCNKFGHSALNLAITGCKKNLYEENVIDILLKNGCSLETSNLRYSPLVQAIIDEQDSIVEQLVHAGFDLSPALENEETPLQLLVKRENVRLIQLFIAAGCNLRKESWLKRQPLPTDEISKFLIQRSLKVPSLREICRIKIRQLLGQEATSKCNFLPVPTFLVDYLSFKDVS